MDLSIIIVNYATYQMTSDTIHSVIDTVYDISYEIIVVDNDSRDDSAQKLIDEFKDYENINIILNSSNDGFAVANNIGFRNAKGEYTLLLNSDVIVKDDTINNTLSYIKDHPNAGAVGCRILLADGSLDKACKRSFPTVDVSFYRMCGLSKLFPNSPRFNRYNLSYLDECEIHSIDCLVGAYMLMPSSLYKEVGGLDEDYFMYGEDIDLCYKIKKLGYDVIYYGKNTITHYKGASGKNKRLLYEFYNSMDIFYRKHYKDENNFIVNTFIHASIWLMYYVKLILSYIRR